MSDRAELPETALDRARREADLSCGCICKHLYKEQRCCERHHGDIARLEAAAREDGKRITLESLSRMDNDGPIEEWPEIRDALQAMVQAHEAAARLAGRLEQAEYAARESRNAMSLMGLQEFLDHLVDRLRAELAAAGREGE